MIRRAHRWLLALAVMVGSSCSEQAPTTPVVATVEITATAPTVRLGNTLPLSARLRDAGGGTIDSRAIAWSSGTPSVATVSSTGVVSALAMGTTRIAASAFGRSGTITITVLPREVATVQVLPAAVSLRVGVTATIQARTFDADGDLLTGRAIAWSSSNPAIVTVSAAGVLSAVAAGTATVTATSEGRTGQTAVTVTLAPVATVVVAPLADTLPLGGSRTFTATLRDAAGVALTGRTVSWRTSADTIATVSSTGIVNALSPGVTQVIATSEGRTGAATLVVLSRLASSVTLTPATATLIAGTTLSLTAQVTDATGNILVNRPIEFSSSAPTVVTVSPAGVITGVAPGTARIVATSEGRTGSATITVVPIPVSTVQLTPTTATLLTGQSTTFAAIARAANGNELRGRTISWASGAPAILTVSAAGVVTGVSAGTALVLATIDGVSGSATVTVRRPTVVSVLITPTSPEVITGDNLQLTAIARDALNGALPGRTASWTSSDEALAFVSSTGLVIGIRPGTVTITATVEGVSGTTLVTIR